MKDLVGMTKRAEAEGALAVTVFSGFPLADIRDARMSVVAVSDNNPKQARAISETVLNEAWKRRADFVYHSEPLKKSIARAKEISEGPILLIDHADNCASGGTQDTMAVLEEVMRQDLENVAVAAIRDPDAVNQLIHAGVGKRVTIKLGGKMDMPSIGVRGQPLEVSGIVRIISDGEFIVEGPMFTGVRVYMGRTVVLDTGKIQILVIERNHEPWDLGIFTSVGIDPTKKKYILLKSRYHYRAGFLPIARHIIECDGVGVTSSDYSLFNFKKLLRPIYPLDPDAHV